MHILPTAMLYILEPLARPTDDADPRTGTHRVTVNGKAFDFPTLEQALIALGDAIIKSERTVAQEVNDGHKG